LFFGAARRWESSNKNQSIDSREGSMTIPWTVHMPQAMQQHGARRTWMDATESDRLPDLKGQGSQPNEAQDATSRTAPDRRRED
jgi:hypothetical protein